MNFKIIIYLIILLCMFSLVTGCNISLYSDEEIKSIIKENVDVIIPDDAVLVKRYNSRIFLVGRHPAYYIYSFEKEPTSFLEEYNFVGDKNQVLEDEIYDDLLKSSKSYRIKIDENDLFNFEKEYLYAYSEFKYYMLYYVELKQLVLYIIPT